MDTELKSLSHVQATLADMALRFGPKLLVALIIFGLGLLVARWVARTSERALHRFALEPPVRLLLVRLARVLVLAVFAMMALQNLGVELLPLIAGISVAGAGLALATQGVLSNVVAGLTIIFTKPYRVGEFISIIGVEGTVETISLFSTVLAHADKSRVVVPNRKIVGEVLHNYGRIRQAEVTVRVSYSADLALALTTIGALVRANQRVLADPAPQVSVSRLDESVVLVAARPWVGINDYGAIESELSVAILDALRGQGIALPSPQLQVQLVGTPVVPG